MLFRLSPREKTQQTPDALAHALACHERIRKASSTTLRIAEAPDDTPAAHVVEAAEAVRRYYTLALPLHAEDEDASFAPRLRAIAADAALDAALDRLTREHGTMEAQTLELAETLKVLESEPLRLAELRPLVAKLGTALQTAWEAHLGLEESLVFPTARRVLAPEELASIHEEMRARRATRGFSL